MRRSGGEGESAEQLVGGLELVRGIKDVGVVAAWGLYYRLGGYGGMELVGGNKVDDGVELV